eukprot:GDKI01002858.1.p1 GENE.GDKI01002858.1~~GDKI01002858.1.p1  ORF type:complete len:147 (-),score=49.35 GDKI01002858.1:267-707(-)
MGERQSVRAAYMAERQQLTRAEVDMIHKLNKSKEELVGLENEKARHAKYLTELTVQWSKKSAQEDQLRLDHQMEMKKLVERHKGSEAQWVRMRVAIDKELQQHRQQQAKLEEEIAYRSRAIETLEKDERAHKKLEREREKEREGER